MSFNLIINKKKIVQERRRQKINLLSKIEKTILLNSDELMVSFKIEKTFFNIINHIDSLLNFEYLIKEKFPITGNEWKKNTKRKSFFQLLKIKKDRGLL